MKLKTIKSRIREEEHQRLVALAARDELSIAYVVRKAVRELLERENGKEQT